MKEFLKKFRSNKITKMLFNGKNKNSILSVVALVECIVVLAFTTYSWIESASSLVIKGDDLPISHNINYRFDVKDGATNMVDLNSYFRPTALYQMAQASSPDGTNFYFKKANASTYRLGNTTDYNTSYYNFDFQVHNETAKTFNYYFEKSDIFTVTSDQEIDESVLDVAEGAFRIAVTAGTNTSNTRIYSRDTVSYNAINNIAGTSQKLVTTTGLSGDSQYKYETNTNNSISVFSTTGGGDDTKVNLKIWFEETDAKYKALSADDKKKLEGATVKINLKFVNSESNFQTFFFDDYTFSTEEGHEGMHVTSEDQTKKMYFCYTDGTTTSIVPMTTTTSPNDEATRWVTASDDGEPTPRISDAMRNDLAENPSHGYFFYGTYNASTGVHTTHYKWNITKPAVNDANVYIFKALSVVKHNTNLGYGVWDNVPIKLWYFKDQTSSATTEAYNTSGYQFITKSGQNKLYLSNTTKASVNATRMYYDASTDTYKGYFDSSVTNPIFSYISGSDNFIDSNIKVQWTASNPTEYNGETVYKALGYEGADTVASQETIAVGVGTWQETEQILLSTELVDASMNKDFRYKIGVHFNDTLRFYYMTKHKNALTWGAFVPKNSGNTVGDYITFQRFDDVEATGHAGTWNSTATLRDGSNKFYATDMAATTSNGQWHIGVVVDGSADNVVNDVLSTVESSKLEYSIDGGATYVEMNKLDDRRWYTGDFSGAVTSLNYRFTAYEGEGVVETVFTYGHDLVDGIYLTIKE